MSEKQTTSIEPTEPPKCRYCGSEMRGIMLKQGDVSVGYCPRCDGPVHSLAPGWQERRVKFLMNVVNHRPGVAA